MYSDIFSQALESNVFKKNFLLLLSFIFLLAACQEEDDDTVDTLSRIEISGDTTFLINNSQPITLKATAYGARKNPVKGVPST